MCFVFGPLPPDLGMRIMLSGERQHAMESLSWQKCEVVCPLSRSSTAQKNFLAAGFGALLSSYTCLLRWKCMKSFWGTRSHTLLLLHQGERPLQHFQPLDLESRILPKVAPHQVWNELCNPYILQSICTLNSHLDQLHWGKEVWRSTCVEGRSLIILLCNLSCSTLVSWFPPAKRRQEYIVSSH